MNAGLTREQVYQQTGISQKTLYSWEKGLTFPKVNKLNQLCELYAVPIEYIKK